MMSASKGGSERGAWDGGVYAGVQSRNANPKKKKQAREKSKAAIPPNTGHADGKKKRTQGEDDGAVVSAQLAA